MKVSTGPFVADNGRWYSTITKPKRQAGESLNDRCAPLVTQCPWCPHGVLRLHRIASLPWATKGPSRSGVYKGGGRGGRAS